ncbi:Dyp-type peroxidase [Alloalcanivorax xenomutans]|uniref:Dyp-type peroxidase n=1 Tax=Alloalcanivorax xenomutans TaxID=1094342 RepID=A0A9Q3ZFA5_9GAMM|nr:Dyp-type peroxidase [Alloalcanivorax xenomutans]MCE7509356.1 Dyp-type peroxidase [Alloalcanivorax xenomutans]PHS60361.1 MAG: peroxidase [Alcanivorax sp.]
MSEHQAGLFDRHYTHHLFLEFALGAGADMDGVRQALRDVLARAPASTPLLMAFGPGLWQKLSRSFRFPPFSLEGKAPSTQGDLLIWIQAENPSDLFDTALVASRRLREVLALQLEVQGFVYHDMRDLSGFVDGIGNPTGDKALAAAVIPEGQPGAGGSWMITQKWVHKLESFNALPVEEQEKVFGRTKADAVEFDEENMPENSHVGRTDVDHDGVPQKIWRRSVPYGTTTEHGSYFIAFTCERERFEFLLRRMYGMVDGVRDRLLDYSRPVTGSWWYAPSQEWLSAL